MHSDSDGSYVNLERLNSALSSYYRKLVFLTPATCPSTLIAALSEYFPHLDAGLWEERLAHGGTYVNGARCHTDMTLVAPCQIEFYELKDSALTADFGAAFRIQDFVVHEDEALLIVYKPCGLSSMPTREQSSLNLKAFLEKYLQETSPGSNLHMPSRIDTSVQGLVITSKNSSFHTSLQRSFERRLIHKKYRMEAAGRVDWDSLEVDLAIARDTRHAVLRRCVKEGGKASLTHFSKLAEKILPDGTPHSLIEASPVTGRTHQIRVHASTYGFPIVGDNFYGGIAAPELHLMSYQARFPHPVTGKEIEITAPAKFLPEWLREFS